MRSTSIRPAPGGAASPYAAAPPRKAGDKNLALILFVAFFFQLFYFTAPPDFLDNTKTDDPNQPAAAAQAAPVGFQADPYGRIIKLGCLVLGVSALYGRKAATRALFKRLNRPLVWFLVLVPLSTLWSISPGDTVNRAITLASHVSLLAAISVVYWDPQRFQNVMRPALTGMLFASIIFVFYNPNLALEHGGGVHMDGAWRGLTSQKNVFGSLTTMAAIFWLHAFLAKQGNALWNLAGLALSLTCLALSRSSTCLMSAFLAFFFMTLLMYSPKAMRRYMPYIVGGFVTLVLTYALVILQLVPGLDVLLTPITALTGKDTTFSNRSVIWGIIREHIQLSPMIGTGYGAYWIGPVPSSPSYTFLARMYFYPSESHNGYLEIVNDLGFVGFAVVISYLVTYVRQALAVLRFDRAQGALFLTLFFQQAINNLSESLWMNIKVVSVFDVMLLATFATSRALGDGSGAKPAAQPGALRGRSYPQGQLEQRVQRRY